ncbi:MAG: AmmeMemoRadiSam system protein A [Oscillospiraceae bacterium]|nr:AmmeMemoRadiSam system protein A [Oscillospiraceae bacterium]
MSLIRAFALPHPPLAVPDVGKGEEQKIKNTLSAFEEISEEIAAVAPETIVFITPHSTMYSDYFHISPGRFAVGDMSRFNAKNVHFKAEYDVETVNETIRLAHAAGIPAGTAGERNAALDHGVTVAMFYINRRYDKYRLVRISQSGMGPQEHYRLGRCITEAAEKLGRKTVLIASGDLSHKLKADGPYGFAPEGAVYDGEITKVFSTGDFSALFGISDNLCSRAAECGRNSFLVLAGCFDRMSVEARLLSYEGPFGVGYAAAVFTPGERDEGRAFAERYSGLCLAEAEEKKTQEDPYRALARVSLEHAVKNGGVLPLPQGLSDELLDRKAGVFVSLHKNGRLRGCIGTIMPVEKNIALEIIRNAVSAGLHDSRFEPVTAVELPYLTYKTDVLSEPEPVSSPAELDVKRYGVIVSCGGKRGLLLPNLDGVDTVQEQIDIARKKAGIPENTEFKLERFEVVRHE